MFIQTSETHNDRLNCSYNFYDLGIASKDNDTFLWLPPPCLMWNLFPEPFVAHSFFDLEKTKITKKFFAIQAPQKLMGP